MNNIHTISAFHRLLSLPDPTHPLVSVARLQDVKSANEDIWKPFSVDFYTISLKREVRARMKYGQQYYDFDKGIMSFTSPKQAQLLEMIDETVSGPQFGKGFVLMIHPDFLRRHPLAANIKNYGFFSYAVNESLHLSPQEEKNIVDVFRKIEQEGRHIDKHTQSVMLSQIDLLLNYCNRFYERQFITRKAANSDLLTKFEQLLEAWFETNDDLKRSLPTVEYLAGRLNLSPHYLTDMLRSLTGQSTQAHIHEKLIEKAKERLSTTTLSVSEIAYELGFEHPQSFSKLFKAKTELSPRAFRESFS
ncbi:Helix-turn-helix domain-containing protein [Chitinophaga sp. YR627]|uniref:helix-turn-helix domain-containing protein n=1 Tax=Chitinophaga sp. YR627 TaxID=1881041 RepID=UPI0008E7AF01|nr:helix-turn-helix transcriptional regulator [Chitinophaga sp. YR627]SFN21473.1 Helix-turn-helix domain-containing protein [Chitinophaga sp. YR627]